MQYVVSVLISLAVLWLVLVVALVALRPKGLRVNDAVRLMPDVIILAGGLARDRSLPRRVRARIWILLAWMASPIDLIPDVIPVVGMVDDVVLAYLVLRSVARASGADVIERHWRGSPEALAAVERLLQTPRRVRD